jgi:ABC-2 type transport system ATP-binding protein
MTAICCAENLTRTFGDTIALDGVSFEVRAGDIFALLGPNGAGKSTAMRILLTLLRPTSGTATVNGLDVTTHPVRIRRLTGWVPQDRNSDPLLTTRENLLFMAGLYHLNGRDARRRAAEVLEVARLTSFSEKIARDLSGGTRRRLELAMGLVQLPSVLFLDEPTLGLDIGARRDLWSYIRQVRDDGTTIVLTTHYLEEADALCDRVAIIDRGRILADGSPAELKQRFARLTLDEVFLAATRA